MFRVWTTVFIVLVATACSSAKPDTGARSPAEAASSPSAEVSPASSTSVAGGEQASPTAEAGELADTLGEAESTLCPVSEVDYGFWQGTGGVAGEFPVWMSSRGESTWDESRLGPIILPPDDGTELFDKGYLSKTLVFVDRSVDGDLTIAGERVGDGHPLYFFSDSNSTRISDTTLRLLADPQASLLIRSANETNRSPNPPGKATHGMGPIYTGPGCWRFTFQIAEFETQVFISFVSNPDAG